jgi:hypothetical protein
MVLKLSFNQNFQSNPVSLNNHENDNKSTMENYEFRIGELEVQNEELLAELNVIY